MSSQGHRIPGIPDVHFQTVREFSPLHYTNVREQVPITFPNLRESGPINYHNVREAMPYNFSHVREPAPINYSTMIEPAPQNFQPVNNITASHPVACQPGGSLHTMTEPTSAIYATINNFPVEVTPSSSGVNLIVPPSLIPIPTEQLAHSNASLDFTLQDKVAITYQFPQSTSTNQMVTSSNLSHVASSSQVGVTSMNQSNAMQYQVGVTSLQQANVTASNQVALRSNQIDVSSLNETYVTASNQVSVLHQSSVPYSKQGFVTSMTQTKPNASTASNQSNIISVNKVNVTTSNELDINQSVIQDSCDVRSLNQGIMTSVIQSNIASANQVRVTDPSPLVINSACLSIPKLKSESQSIKSNENKVSEHVKTKPAKKRKHSPFKVESLMTTIKTEDIDIEPNMPGTSKGYVSTLCDKTKTTEVKKATEKVKDPALIAKARAEYEAIRLEYPWLSCDGLPEKFTDENYLPQGDIIPNCESDPGMEGFDEHIISFMKEQNIPGLSLCISRKRAIIYTQCYGWATKTKRLEPSHMFRIASVSKVLTALGILHLCDMGKLRVATRVFGEKGVFPDLGPSKKGDRRLYNVTVKHLLQHAGGWDRDVADDPVYYTAEEMGMEPGLVEPWALVEYMLTQKLQFLPGSRYAYSNFGYLLLGLIIEKVSGVSYEKYVGGLMDACSLSGMVLGTTKHEDKHPLEVDYYSGPGARQGDSVFPGEDKVDAPYGGFCIENSAAFGGWVATPTHLVRLSHELELGHILKPSVVRKMKMKPDFCKDRAWYGMGLDVQFNGKHYEHSGMIDGATSILTHSRDGYTWAVSCNYWPADVDYNSVIQYGLCLVKGWTRLTPFLTPKFDGATHLGMYAFSVQLTHFDFLKRTKFSFNEGYRIHYINSYTYQGTLLFNVIWVIDGKDGRFLMDIDCEKAKDIITKQKSNGFVPTHIELYVWNDKLMCCIIFMKSEKTVQFVLHNQTENLEEEIGLRSEKGWVPNVVCICVKGEEKWVAMLYHQSQDKNWVRVCMQKEVYQRTLAKQNHYGHMPIYVRIHQVEAEPLYTAIWSNPGPYLFTSDFEMSKFRLLGDFVSVENEDFLPHCISGYESEAAHKFVAVFVKAVEHHRYYKSTKHLPKSN